MTYSLDYRQRVMGIQEKEKLTFEETSRRFGVGMRTLFRWHKKVEPCKKRNKPATKVDMDLLKEDIKESPDAYLSERAEKFEVSTSCIFYAMKRLGVTYKKNSDAPQSERKATYQI